jgi:uncharacterized protein
MSTTYQDPIGWPFLPVPQNGQLSFPTLERSVRDSIRVILTTRQGEQLMRPRFGAGLQNFLNEDNTVAIRAQIQNAIQQSLQSYENRIIVDAVYVDPVANSGRVIDGTTGLQVQPLADGSSSQVQVQIYYRLLRTNQQQQIGLTMQVGS